jgi:hypothetical protein
LALMEEYLPGRTENLHDYLIPTIGDVPDIECILIEDREPLGPSGAKGVGEPGLVPTAPAILGAVHHATGVRATRVPLLPHRLREALLSLPNEVGEVSAKRTEGSKASPLMPMTPPALRATSPASLGRKEKR